MKKRVNIILIMFLVILAACGGNVTSEQVDESSADETSVETVASISIDTSSENVIESEIEEGSEEDYDQTAYQPATTYTIEGQIYSVDEYPIIDGSTSLKPLGVGMTSEFLGISRDEADRRLSFHTTDEAYFYLENGESDLLIAAQACDAVMEEYEKENFQYDIEPIAMEGLVFVVNVNNPVNSLTVDQIKGIYTGRITNWKEVGGEDLPIAAFQRTETSGSQVMMRKCVMTDCQLADAATELRPASMGGLIEGVASYNNAANAIGYTVYYYADSMKMADDLKILNVNGIEPCNDTISAGTYPFLNPYYCIIRKDAGENAPERAIYNWLVSSDGQDMVAKSGYVPVDRDALNRVKSEKYDYRINDNLPDKYTKLGNNLGLYKTGSSNGYIFPFVRTVNIDRLNMEMDEPYYYRYDFVDENGTIVSEAYYDEIISTDDYYRARYYQGEAYYITKDGSHVAQIDYSGRYDDVQVMTYVYNDLYYQFIIDSKDQSVVMNIYDLDGNLMAGRTLEFDRSIIKERIGMQYTGEFSVFPEDFMNGKYLQVITQDENGVLSSVIDTDTNKFVFKEQEYIKICDNNTFIVKPDANSKYYLYDCNGMKVDDKVFENIKYLGDDYYLVEGEKESNCKIVLLQNGRLKVVNEYKPGEYGLCEGYLVDRQEDLTKLNFYNFNGTPAENSDRKVAMLKNLITIDNLYTWNEGNSYEAYYFIDTATRDSKKPMYYTTQKVMLDKPALSLYDAATGEILFTAERKYESAMNVQNGIAGFSNCLYNIKTGELVFKFTPFEWDYNQ